MRVSKELTRTVAHTGDIMNTLNGGMSLAYIEKYKHPDHLLIDIKVPGVSQESLKIEMHQGQLFIFQHLELEGMDVPNLITMLPISSRIDAENIEAHYLSDHLQIKLPYNDWIDEHREIDIT